MRTDIFFVSLKDPRSKGGPFFIDNPYSNYLPEGSCCISQGNRNTGAERGMEVWAGKLIFRSEALRAEAWAGGGSDGALVSSFLGFISQPQTGWLKQL